MSVETTSVIMAQTKLMTLDLQLTLQRMKVSELDARAQTLYARRDVEDYKLKQMIEEFRQLDK